MSIRDRTIGGNWWCQLPVHQAPVAWEDIEAELDLTSDRFADLPKHRPPALVWDEIASHLGSRKLKHRQRRKWLAAAAIGLLLLGTVWIWHRSSPTSDLAQQLRHEIDILPEHAHRAFLEQDMATEAIDSFCLLEPAVCQDASVQQLKADFVKLTRARDTLLHVMTPFDTGHQLQKRLAKIELERADIIRTMMNKIQNI